MQMAPSTTFSSLRRLWKWVGHPQTITLPPQEMSSVFPLPLDCLPPFPQPEVKRPHSVGLKPRQTSNNSKREMILKGVKGTSTGATPKLAVLTDLLTIGAGRGLGPIESPLHRGQFPEPLSIAFTLLTPSPHSMEKNSSAALYFDIFSFPLPSRLTIAS